MLEVIQKGKISEQHPHPLLFVHGAWYGGWCWDEHFLDYFAERHFHAVALSLRGHGASKAPGSVRLHSIADYADDVSSIAEALPSSPVLVGHSMGGFVVQKYLEKHNIPAAVLIAPTPPRGHLRSLLRSTRRHPWLTTKFAFTGRPSDLYTSTAEARGFLFGDDASYALVESVTARLQVDSARAILFDMVVGDLIRPRTITTPLLVIGGAQDQIYPPDDVRRTAAAYQTQPVFFSGIGHELMLEPGWEKVADYIESWLNQQGL